MEKQLVNNFEGEVESVETVLFDRIQNLLERYEAVTDERNEFFNTWATAMQNLKASLETALREKGFSIRDLQGVPEWHALLGATFPDEHAISPEAHEVVVGEIKTVLPMLESLVEKAEEARQEAA